MAIKSIFHINVNCRDLDRSRAFYESLGFKVVLDLKAGGAAEMLRGLALPAGSRGRAVRPASPRAS